jgi:hypothetical protein
VSDLTEVDIPIEPDAAAIERARAVNRRMPLSIPAGITLDDTPCRTSPCRSGTSSLPTRRVRARLG